jgi:hypothetical protein
VISVNYYNHGNDDQSNLANISLFGRPGGGTPRPENIYPGIGNDPYGNTQINNIADPSGVSNLPVPVEATTEVVQTTAERGGLASMLNMNQIKGFIDRMGGIEGIVNTFGKVQGFMKSVTQMAPMIKMLYSTFAGGAKGGINSTKSSTKSKRKKSTKSKKTVTTKKKSSTKRKI